MAQKKIQPIGNKLIVLPLPKKEEKVDSLFIPETSNAVLSEGMVIEVSDEIKEAVQPSNTVIYSTGSGVGCFYQGKPHVWLQLHEIWGILEK